jgi:hypothetical protein
VAAVHKGRRVRVAPRSRAEFLWRQHSEKQKVDFDFWASIATPALPKSISIRLRLRCISNVQWGAAPYRKLPFY